MCKKQKLVVRRLKHRPDNNPTPPTSDSFYKSCTLALVSCKSSATPDQIGISPATASPTLNCIVLSNLLSEFRSISRAWAPKNASKYCIEDA